LRLESSDAHTHQVRVVQQGDWAVPMVFYECLNLGYFERVVFYQPLFNPLHTWRIPQEEHSAFLQ
jgi:hypothetical protein